MWVQAALSKSLFNKKRDIGHPQRFARALRGSTLKKAAITTVAQLFTRMAP
jgi:hypothetical protein